MLLGCARDSAVIGIFNRWLFLTVSVDGSHECLQTTLNKINFLREGRFV